MNYRVSVLLLLLGAFFVSGGADARVIPARALQRSGFCARKPALCQSPVNRRRLSERPNPASAEGARNR